MGDERIYLIMGEDKNETLRLAVSFVRSAFAHLNSEEPYYVGPSLGELKFTYKASVSFGDVTIKRQDEGYKFEGEVYVLTQRYLDALKDVKGPKDFTLVLSASDQGNVEKLILHPQTKKAMLKSYGATEIAMVRDFVEVSQREELWWYARAPLDLYVIFRDLHENFQPNRFFNIFKTCTNFRVYASDPTSKEFVLGILKRHRELRLEDRAVASLISLTGILFSREAMKDEDMEILRQFLKHDNPRVMANTIEVLGRYEALGDQAREFAKIEYNRSAVNALIALGRIDLDHFVGNEITQRLHHEEKDPRVIAGALFAIVQIMQHYLENDPVLLATNKLFAELYAEAAPYLQHSDAKVREICEHIEKTYKKWIFPN